MGVAETYGIVHRQNQGDRITSARAVCVFDTGAAEGGCIVGQAPDGYSGLHCQGFQWTMCLVYSPGQEHADSVCVHINICL